MTIEEIIKTLIEHGGEEVYIHIEGYHLHPCRGKEFHGEYHITEIYIEIPNHIFRLNESEWKRVLEEVPESKYWEGLWGYDRTTYHRYQNEITNVPVSFPEDYVDPTESDRY
tara:strand:- start:78 stop:413 length:336 start_codon:yes stop_codon:yes gene_type:complete